MFLHEALKYGKDDDVRGERKCYKDSNNLLKFVATYFLLWDILTFLKMFFKPKFQKNDKKGKP